MTSLDSLLPDTPREVRAAYIAFALFSFAVPLVRYGIIPVGPTLIQLADLVFAVCAALYLYGLARRTIARPPTKWILAGTLYLAAAAISITGSPNPKASLVKLVAVAYLLMISAVTHGLASRSKDGFRFVLGAWSAAAALTGLLGVAGAALFYLGVKDRSINIFLWNLGSVPVGSYPRIVVFFMNANMLCSYLLVGLGSLGMLAPFVNPRHRRWLVIAAGAMCITATFTLSTGLGGIALGIALAWILWRRRLGKVLLVREAAVGMGALATAAGLAVITIFLLVPKGEGDVRLGPVDLSFETSGRVSVWRSSAATFASHPLRGVGIGTIVAETSHPRALNSTEKLGTGQMHTKPMRMEAHNVWLNVAAQVGLLGFLPFVAMLVIVTATALPRVSDLVPWSSVKIAAFACLLGALYYHGLFGAFEDSRQYWFLFGAILAAGQLADRPAEPTVEPTVDPNVLPRRT